MVICSGNFYGINSEFPETEIYNLGPIINHYMRPSDTTKHNVMKELNSLLSQIGGQPVLEMQLQRLAQHFGFSQIDAEQV